MLINTILILLASLSLNSGTLDASLIESYNCEVVQNVADYVCSSQKDSSTNILLYVYKDVDYVNHYSIDVVQISYSYIKPSKLLFTYYYENGYAYVK